MILDFVLDKINIMHVIVVKLSKFGSTLHPRVKIKEIQVTKASK